MAPLALPRLRGRPVAAAFVGVVGATLLSFLAVGATIPVLPRYVTGPLSSGDLAVGIVIGAFAFTAVIGRPVGGRLADRRGRRTIVLCGLALCSVAGLLLFLPLGVPGLVLARLVLGIGDGWVFTAGLAWAVDLAPGGRRGQAIALYGFGIWGGLAAGPLIGEGLLALFSYEAVWAFAAICPLLGALVVRLVPDRHERRTDPGRSALLPRAVRRPGAALMLANIGYGTFAGFIVLHLAEVGEGGGGVVFTAFATSVVTVRLALARLPDRLGPRVTAIGAGLTQAAGLTVVAVAGGLEIAVVGALVLGAGFSMSFPSLTLLVVERTEDHERGASMGAFSAFLDVGVGIGAPLAGAVSALAGYPAAFAVAAVAAAGGAALVATGPAGAAGAATTARSRPA